MLINLIHPVIGWSTSSSGIWFIGMTNCWPRSRPMVPPPEHFKFEQIQPGSISLSKSESLAMVETASIDRDELARAFDQYEQAVRIDNYKVACILGIVFMPAGVSLDYFVY